MRRKKPKFPRNWRVRLFNAAGLEFCSFNLFGLFQWEASTAAELQAKQYSNCDDWSMVPIP
jgi:hypothetical protein